MRVNMHEAKSRLSELVAAAEAGEEVVIARNGEPAVRLTPIVERYKPVSLGILAGQIELADASPRSVRPRARRPRAAR